MNREHLAIFTHNAQQAGCTVIQCDDVAMDGLTWWSAVAALQDGPAATIPPDRPLDATLVAIAPSFRRNFPRAAEVLITRGAVCSCDATTLAACRIGVCASDGAVAETGSLLLSGAAPQDRLPWLLPPLSVLVVRTERVLATLPEAMNWLVNHHEWDAATLVTGPSRTSDVERVLTIGVQGPRAVVVVVVGSA